MKFKRQSGILLHPTSLPSRHGIGDLGKGAYFFIDFLEASKQGVWQILPLGPTGYGDSPYQCHSAFAGNPMLVSLDLLVEQKLLTKADVEPLPEFDDDKVNYGVVIPYKEERLHKAHRNFTSKHPDYAKFKAFCEEEAFWLEDYALFRAIKEHNNKNSWELWKEKDLIRREPKALDEARQKFADEIDYHRFIQWLFFEQWSAVKRYANERGISIIGDAPIFVAHDSADVWANPELFYMNPDGTPSVVAGVPPDYFSETGQYWGNPLYRWDVMKKDHYQWWAKRIAGTLKLVDIIRIDHFRGFEAYWEIQPNKERSAVHGKWVKGPYDDFFNKMLDQLGELPLIAEDLGVITEPVDNLRKHFELPGMRILQFAFNGEKRFLPHNYENSNTVVYTGTHDNETIAGWFYRTDPLNKETEDGLIQQRERARTYMNITNGTKSLDIGWHFICLGWSSIADLAIAPMQDFLGLDNSARMNYPGQASGWWQWRCRTEYFTVALAEKLAYLTDTCERIPF